MRHGIAALLAALMLLTLAGCGQKDGGSGDEDFNEGRVGDVMHTVFFDYTVNDAYTCGAYGNYTASEGGKVLVVEVTIKNTFSKTIEMYDTDFQILWGGEDDDDFRVPITTDPDTWEELDVVGEDQLPGTYTLGVNKERTGLLVYDVPADVEDFSIAYLEIFEDESEGDLHAVFFTPEETTI